MKKVIFLTLTLFASISLQAQWQSNSDTTVINTTAKVGINNSNPQAPLSIQGDWTNSNSLLQFNLEQGRDWVFEQAGAALRLKSLALKDFHLETTSLRLNWPGESYGLIFEPGRESTTRGGKIVAGSGFDHTLTLENYGAGNYHLNVLGNISGNQLSLNDIQNGDNANFYLDQDFFRFQNTAAATYAFDNNVMIESGTLKVNGLSGTGNRLSTVDEYGYLQASKSVASLDSAIAERGSQIAGNGLAWNATTGKLDVGGAFLPQTGGNINGILYINDENDAPLRVTSTDAWSGVTFTDPNNTGTMIYEGAADRFELRSKLWVKGTLRTDGLLGTGDRLVQTNGNGELGSGLAVATLDSAISERGSQIAGNGLAWNATTGKLDMTTSDSINIDAGSFIPYPYKSLLNMTFQDGLAASGGYKYSMGVESNASDGLPMMAFDSRSMSSGANSGRYKFIGGTDTTHVSILNGTIQTDYGNSLQWSDGYKERGSQIAGNGLAWNATTGKLDLSNTDMSVKGSLELLSSESGPKGLILKDTVNDMSSEIFYDVGGNVAGVDGTIFNDLDGLDYHFLGGGSLNVQGNYNSSAWAKAYEERGSVIAGNGLAWNATTGKLDVASQSLISADTVDASVFSVNGQQIGAALAGDGLSWNATTGKLDAADDLSQWNYNSVHALLPTGSIGLGVTVPNGRLDINGLRNSVGVRVTGTNNAGHWFLGMGSVTGDAHLFNSNIHATGSVSGTIFNGGTGNSKMVMRTNGQDAGDPFSVYSVYLNGEQWSMGIDNSDEDKFKIGNNPGPSSNNPLMTMTTEERVGIGTSNPNHTLDVAGQINATDFLINGNSLSSQYMPLSGGTLNNQLTVAGISDAPLKTKSTDSWTGIEFIDPNNSSFLFYRGDYDRFEFDSDVLFRNGVRYNALAGTGNRLVQVDANGVQSASLAVEDLSPWTNTNGDISFDGGRVNIGNPTPSSLPFIKVHVADSVENAGILVESGPGKQGHVGFKETGIGGPFEGNTGGMYWDGTERFLALKTYVDGSDIVLNPDLGNVGIGTDNPERTLEVYEANGAATTRIHSGLANGVAMVDFYTDGSRVAEVIAGRDNDDLRLVNNLASPDADIVFRVQNNNEVMRVKGDGTIGIGKDNPGHKLDVAGTVNATEFMVGGTSLASSLIGNGLTLNTETGKIDVDQATRVFSKVSYDTAPSWGNWNLFSYGESVHTSGDMSNVTGGYLLSLNKSTGTLLDSKGVWAAAGNESSGTGHTVDAYGFYAQVQKGAGTVENGYGLYIKDVQATNAFGVYQDGINAKNYFAGNVSVGAVPSSTVPFEKFSVVDTTGSAGMFVESAAGRESIYGFRESDGTIGASMIWNGADDQMVMETGVAEAEIIMATNRVGIGTSSPSAMLEVAGTSKFGDNMIVNGRVTSSRVRVSATPGNWPDYVFKKEYTLRPLSEVEAFINANGHLPNIPKAEVVEKEGQDVGEIQTKLLEKVEELTLYLIEQKKEIEALKKELNSLKKGEKN